MNTNKYTISADGNYVTQETFDANGKFLSATALTKAQIQTTIAQLTTQIAGVPAQVAAQQATLQARADDLTDNALSLFPAK